MVRPAALFSRLSLDDSSMLDLLAYRVLFDKTNGDASSPIDLAQDVKDLQIYPERLDASYRDEWLTYVKRAIAKTIRTQDKKTLAEIADKLHHQQQDVKQTSEKYNLLAKFVTQAELINQQQNVTPLPHSLKRELERLLNAKP